MTMCQVFVEDRWLKRKNSCMGVDTWDFTFCIMAACIAQCNAIFKNVRFFQSPMLDIFFHSLSPVDEQIIICLSKLNLENLVSRWAFINWLFFWLEPSWLPFSSSGIHHRWKELACLSLWLVFGRGFHSRDWLETPTNWFTRLVIHFNIWVLHWKCVHDMA